MSNPQAVPPINESSPRLGGGSPDRPPPAEPPSDDAAETFDYVFPPEALAERQRRRRSALLFAFLALHATFALGVLVLWWVMQARTVSRPLAVLASLMRDGFTIFLPVSIAYGGLFLLTHYLGRRSGPRRYRVDAEGMHITTGWRESSCRWSQIRRWRLAVHDGLLPIRFRHGSAPRRNIILHGRWLSRYGPFAVPAGAPGDQMVEAITRRLPADARRPDRISTSLKVTPISAILLGILFLAQMLLVAWLAPVWAELIDAIGGHTGGIALLCSMFVGFAIGLCHLWALLPENRVSRQRLKTALGLAGALSFLATVLGFLLGVGATAQPPGKAPQIPPPALASAPASDQPASHRPQA